MASEHSHPEDRCGKSVGHTPHWHGPKDKTWCDGKRPLPNSKKE